MPKKRLSCWCTGLVAAAILSGCTVPPRDGAMTQHRIAAVDDDQRDWLWESAQEVLRRHQFRLDRVDRRAGVITTAPQTSQHAFEFWRKDVATAHDYLEATMRTVRRSVEVQVNREDEQIAHEGGAATVTVIVRRETIASPERQFNSSIVAIRMFGNELPRADTGERITDEDTYWIDAGRDLAMERYLLERITRRAGVANTA
jgi:Holliday junction resolvase-like predicted endonuclease